MDGDQPRGGQWSFDEANRKKVPRSTRGQVPRIELPKMDAIDVSVRAEVEKEFGGNPGTLDELYLPTSHESAKVWLGRFVKQRLVLFGAYEDAILEHESFLWHSVLTPMLNIGLLSPRQVIDTALDYAACQQVPLNSIEGFVRQVIGWREFMRATYEDLGTRMRTSNAWSHHRSLPDCFYDATTGIAPVDTAIRRLLKYGYCHHIERLMALGGFMFLCEIEPHDIYRWFMEMFVDSYDWVMVPNVYAMSQHADGGLITTKPYFCGSAYIKRMSDYATGKSVTERAATGDAWWEIWDGLYWRWIENHRADLARNPRWAMMCKTAEKMDPTKMARHFEIAVSYLEWLDTTGK